MSHSTLHQSKVNHQMLLSEIVGFVSGMMKIPLGSTLAFGVTLRVPHGHLLGPYGKLQILKQYQEIVLPEF